MGCLYSLIGIAKYTLDDFCANQGRIALPDLMLYRAKATKDDNQVYENMEYRRQAYAGIKSSIGQGKDEEHYGVATTRVRLCFQV